MKPRNKYEKRVAELNATLSEDIAESNVQWVKEACKYWDMTHFCYFTVHSNMAEFMVRRLYRVYKFTDKSADHFFFVEIMREFSNDGHKLYFGKQRTMGCYYDCFLYNSTMELRSTHKNYAYNDITMLFPLSMDSVPEDNSCSRIKCVSLDPKELGRVICNNPVAETMYKQSNPMFKYLVYRRYLKETCRAYTIAKRHGFVFNEETIPLWLDMVNAIIVCKYDWHNPVFIAPSDLRATHDRFIKMRERKREEEERRAAIELKMEKADRSVLRDKRTNDAYIKRRKRFYDMVLTDGLIAVKVLPDVPAFREEADYMHHCVYTNAYYKKPYSLILSARIKDQRVETIEVDLTNFSIKQCFGKHNQFTMHHKRIIDLVNGQMDVIKAHYQRRTKKQVKIAV